MQSYGVTSKHHLVQNLPKAVRAWSSPVLQQLCLEQVCNRSQRHWCTIYSRQETTLCLPLCPGGRNFQCIYKAFIDPYCGPEGELPQNIFQAWLPSDFSRGWHTQRIPNYKSPLFKPQIPPCPLSLPPRPGDHRIRDSLNRDSCVSLFKTIHRIHLTNIWLASRF